MATIAEENTKYLRKAVDIYCGYDEASAECSLPGSWLMPMEVGARDASEVLTVDLQLADGSIQYITLEEGTDYTWTSFLPEGYQEVEYVESSGNLYVDTGWIISTDDVVYVKAQVIDRQSAESKICGVESTSNFACGVMADGTWLLRGFTYTGTSTTERFRAVGTPTTTQSITLYLFASHYQNQALNKNGQKRIYSFEIAHQGCYYHWVPCVRKTDGIAGFFSTSSNQFIEPVGGLLTAGPNSYSNFADLNFVIPQDANLRRIVNGRAWLFNKENLINCNVVLRSVGTEVNPSLEASEIEIEAYVPTDLTELMAESQYGAPIWYFSGYPGDFSPMRRFYVSDQISWKDNVLTLRGSDATMFLDGTYRGFYTETTQNKYRLQMYGQTIEQVLNEAGVNYTKVGTLPEGTDTTVGLFFVNNPSERQLIAQAVNLYHQNNFTINYVDAGRPTLTYGPLTTTWNIADSQIWDYEKKIEIATESVTANVVRGSIGETGEIVTISGDVGSLQTYVSSEAVRNWTCSGGLIKSAAPFEVVVKLTSSSAVLSGGRFNWESSQISYSSGKEGQALTVDDVIIVLMDNVNYTKQGIQALLNRSNITHEFKFRGIPSMMPRDRIVLTIDGVSTTLTVDSVTHEHSSGGGYMSQIVAREGIL